MRKAAWILAIALVGVTGFFGLLNARNELANARTPLQQSVAFGVMLYGALGLLGAAGLARRRPWSVTMCAAWGLVVTYVATVASFAFSDPTFSKGETIGGVVGAGISTALIGVFVVWAARDATRANRVPRPGESGHIPSP